MRPTPIECMNRQEIFDIVVTNLLKQKKRSFGEYKPTAFRYNEAHLYNGCLYRSPEGLKCAVGWLIPDELYIPEMENLPIELLVENHVTAALHKIGISDNDFPFVQHLQYIHDSFSPDEWTSQFLKAAYDYNLKPDEVFYANRNLERTSRISQKSLLE